MGKREGDGKEHKRSKKTKATPTPTPEPELETMSVPAAVQEEEVVCEGDVVDVMDTSSQEMELHTTLSTPTPTPPKPPSASKSAASSSASKKSSKSVSLNMSGPSTSAAAAAATAAAVANTSNSSSKKSKKRRDSGTSSEEERWLTAIESGKLEEMDEELKKMKDPKLMTARQRAMYERNMDKEPSPGGELLMSLPIGYREKEKPQTAEDIQKAALKSQKRKQLADEKREKDKKKTMERLLKKQESKQRNATRSKVPKVAQPMISYRNTLTGAYIHMPPEHEFPLKPQVARAPPKAQLCGIAGCGKPKVYNCSKTNLPLCSFACYRKNVQNVRQIMC